MIISAECGAESQKELLGLPRFARRSFAARHYPLTLRGLCPRPTGASPEWGPTPAARSGADSDSLSHA